MIASEIGDIKVDNQYNYDRLLVSIEASDRILSLLIAVCDDELQREEIIRRYEQELASSVKPYRLQLDREEPSLRMAVAKAVAVDEYLQQGNRAVFTALGADLLRTWLPNEERTPQDKFLGYLQWTREGMREFPFPIVLWVSSSVVEKIARKAPDFWSWRKGVFRFVSERTSRASSTIPIQDLANIQNYLPDFSKPDREDSNSLFLEIADLEELVAKVVKDRGAEDRSLETLYSQLGQIYKNRIQTGKAINLSLEKDLAIDYLQKAIALQTKYKSEFTLIATLSDLADLYQSQGQNQSALLLYQQVVKIAQETKDRIVEANSFGNIGIVYNALEKHQEAIQYLLQALEIQQKIGERNGEAASLNNLGNAYYSLGQYQQAMQYYLQALENMRKIGDQNGEASSLGNLGNSYNALGQYQKAIQHYQEALESMRKIGNRNGEASSLANLGNAYESLGQYQEAIRYSQQALEIQREIGDRNGEVSSLSSLCNAYNNRGVAKYNLGDPEGAIADYNEAIRLNPNYANAYNSRGVAKYTLGDPEGAIADYNEAIRLNPNNINSYSNRGVAKYALGDKAGAIADYNEAIHLNPNYVAAYYGRGVAKYHLGDYEGAIVDYNEAIRLNPNDAISYNNRGNAKSALGDYEGAITDCNEAIRLNPDLYNAHWGLAIIWDRRFTDSQDPVDLEQAISAYGRAVTLPSDDRAKLREELADALYRLGVYYVKDGRWYDGLAQLQTSLDYYRQTDNSERRADVLAQIARVQLLFGDSDRARLFYRDALRLYCHINHKPGIANCRLALGRMMLSLGYLEDAQHELEVASTLYAELESPRKAEAEEVLQFVHQFQTRGATAA